MAGDLRPAAAPLQSPALLPSSPSSSAPSLAPAAGGSRTRKDAAVLALDRTTALAGALLWGLRCWLHPSASFAANAQMIGVLSAAFLTMCVWPSAHPPSYLRWRPLLMPALRLSICQPFNVSQDVIDIFAPGASASPTLGWLVDGLRLGMASNAALMLYAAFGAPLPFGQHMLAQAVNVAFFIRFGSRPFCSSKLLTSPKMRGRMAMFHHGMAAAAAALSPPGCPFDSLIPATEHGQCTAFLAAYWTAGCWLLPTLLLLPKRRPVSSLERCLQALLGRDLKQQQQHAADAAGLEPGGTHRSVLLLRWWMLAVLGWAACCVLLGG